MPSLKSVLIFGASRGIGASTAETLATKGYLVGVVSKTTTAPANTGVDDLKGGSIHQVANTINTKGGLAVALQCDVRDDDQVRKTVSEFMRWVKEKSSRTVLDAVVYNSGAIYHQTVALTPLKRYDLLHQVNARGFYSVVHATMPYLCQSQEEAKTSTTCGGRFIAISPPLYNRFLRGKAAYAATKYTVTLLVKAMSEEEPFNNRCAFVSLWPAKGVASAATEFIVKRGDGGLLRKPEIMADAILRLLQDDKIELLNGEAVLDEDYLRVRWGVDDFEQYQYVKGVEPPRMMPTK
jgi:NAD(P)-dependent dehydrogenase (short-subunit alcohol dehydrogenase family)